MNQTVAWILYAVCVIFALSPIGWIAYKWMTWEGEKLPLSIPDKTINGLDKDIWTKRYADYLQKHSGAPRWECEESADISWEFSCDERPEESAQNELDCWE